MELNKTYIKLLEEDNERLRNLLSTKHLEEDKLEDFKKYERLFLFIRNHMTNIDGGSSYDSLKTQINMVLTVYNAESIENKEIIKEFYDNLLGRTFQ